MTGADTSVGRVVSFEKPMYLMTEDPVVDVRPKMVFPCEKEYCGATHLSVNQFRTGRRIDYHHRQ